MSAFTKKRGTIGWPNPQAAAIQRAAEAMDLVVEVHHAQTGTIYLEVIADQDEIYKIRVADHSECYCSEDVSCDPTGYSVRNVIEWLSAKIGQPVPATVERGWRAAETRKVNRLVKQEADIAARRDRVLKMLSDNPDVGTDERGMACGKVAAGAPNRKARIEAAREAISAAYKIVNAKK